jgi:hypothetical protein
MSAKKDLIQLQKVMLPMFDGKNDIRIDSSICESKKS